MRWFGWGRGGGLASAFGGGSGNTAFGSKTGDVLTWATSVIFGLFLLLAVSLNLLANKQTADAANLTRIDTAAQTPAAQTPAAATAGGAPLTAPVTPTAPAVPSTKP